VTDGGGYELSVQALDPCTSVVWQRRTVPVRGYGISAVWVLEDGGRRIDAVQVATSARDAGDPIRFCFAPDSDRVAVQESISIEYSAEYIETVTTGAGQPCLDLLVDARFTSLLDASSPCTDADAGMTSCALDASNEQPAEATGERTLDSGHGGCSTGGGFSEAWNDTVVTAGFLVFVVSFFIGLRRGRGNMKKCRM
jgi:hypothetical protein